MEQTHKATMISNGMGFSGIDAKILTSIADWYIKTGFMSEKQAVLVAKKMKKYHKQLDYIGEFDMDAYIAEKKPPVANVWLGLDE